MLPINSLELSLRLENGDLLNLLDVRESIEYHTYNIGGLNIPLPKLSDSLNKLTYNKTDEIIVICRAGIRSETARQMLERSGYGNIRNLTGGLLALQRLKY